MTDNEYIVSNAGLVKSVERTDEHPYGVKEVEHVDADKPILVLFGGEYTIGHHAANHYIKQMKVILDASEINLDDIDIYSVFYQFGSRHADTERSELFLAAGRKLQPKPHPNAEELHQKRRKRIQENEPEPKYIEKLYNAIMKPLIFGKDGAPLDKIIQNFSKLRFYGYSHGAAAIYMLGKYTKKELQKLGVVSAEITKLMQSVIAIQFGPVAPLEHPEFKTLSFMSGGDTRVDGFNNFSEYMYENAENLYPSYFHILGADMFVVGKISERFDGEHNDEGITSEKNLTEDGKLLFNALRNAIYNATHSTDTDVNKLVAGTGVNFQNMKYNGDVFYNRMLNRLRGQKQIPTPDYQK